MAARDISPGTPLLSPVMGYQEPGSDAVVFHGLSYLSRLMRSYAWVSDESSRFLDGAGIVLIVSAVVDALSVQVPCIAMQRPIGAF